MMVKAVSRFDLIFKMIWRNKMDDVYDVFYYCFYFLFPTLQECWLKKLIFVDIHLLHQI